MVSRGGGGGGGVGCHFSPYGSNAKNKNKSPMLIPILFHEVIINMHLSSFLFRTSIYKFKKVT